MAVFRFRYERLLRLSLQRERQQAYVVGRKMAEIVAQRREVERLKTEWERGRRQWLAQVRRGASAAELLAGSQWLAKARDRIEASTKRLRELHEELEAERARLVELVKRRRTYEKLKERARQRFDEQERKAEQAMLDEIASISDWRRRMEAEQ